MSGMSLSLSLSRDERECSAWPAAAKDLGKDILFGKSLGVIYDSKSLGR